MTPRSSKNALYPLSPVARPRPSSDLPPDVERTYVRPREYAGGEVGVEGVVVEVSVIRSVTIYADELKLCCRRCHVKTYALVERLTLPNEDDVALDEVGIQCLNSC